MFFYPTRTTGEQNPKPLKDNSNYRVSDPEFGIGIDNNELLKFMIRVKKKLSVIESKIILLNQYDDLYGIYDHTTEDSENPIPLAGFHWNEDTVDGNPLYEEVNNFIKFNVLKHTGMSYLEYLNLPVPLAAHIRDVCEKYSKEENEIVERELNEAKKASKF